MHAPAYPSTVFRKIHAAKNMAYVRYFFGRPAYEWQLSGTLPIEDIRHVFSETRLIVPGRWVAPR